MSGSLNDLLQKKLKETPRWVDLIASELRTMWSRLSPGKTFPTLVLKFILIKQLPYTG